MPHGDAIRREVPLHGCWNVRDLGGLTCVDGRAVRRGKVFRAAALDLASNRDLATLGALRLRRIFDLRADRERTPAAAASCARLGLMPWKRDYPGRSGDLRSRLERDIALDMHAEMIAAYRRLPFEQAPAIAAILTALAQDETPLLFHCAVGKDRTGMVAALILGLLGVSRGDIVADYLQTNQHANAIRASLRDHAYLASVREGDESLWAPLVAAHPDYLDALFETIGTDAGAIAAFLAGHTDVTPASIDRIRAHLLA